MAGGAGISLLTSETDLETKRLGGRGPASNFLILLPDCNLPTKPGVQKVS